MKLSYKYFSTIIYSGILLMFILFILCLSVLVNGGGYYCKHCLDPGIYNARYKAKRYIGNYPCRVANDSIHEIKFFWSDPRPKGKFIK